MNISAGLGVVIREFPLKTCTRRDRLRQSILKRAFEGKLVPQDPKDEPASILLELIHGEQRPASQLEFADHSDPRPKKRKKRRKGMRQ